ncbi:MAG: tetratricopeptide repeat protein [Pyrinomonadaceae bacterium]
MPESYNIQNSPNASINILLGKSIQYKDLLHLLETQEKLFNRTPEDDTEERLQISAEINQLKDFIEQFKKDVLQLAQAFQNIKINTGNPKIDSNRLKRAKEYFDKGEFGEARAVLETELEQMQDEQTHLLKKKEHYDKNVLPALINNSEEFFLLAMATRTAYENPNRFEDTCKYFEDSIKSNETKDNLFQYAYFLKKHNQFPKAVDYYNQYLNKFAGELSLEEKAMTLNNLANLHRNQNEYEKAPNEYEEALKIYRNLAKNNPQAFLPDVAMTLNNLAILHRNQNEYEKASNEYEEALGIRRNLAKNNPQAFLPKVAMTLNNLANLHRNQNEHEKASNEYEEALEIRRNLAKDNPQAFLPNVATTLNNLAVLHANQNKYEKASNEYKEALEIYRNLHEQMPNAYAPDLANTLKNLAVFYQESLVDREKSLEYVIEAVMLLRPIVEAVPFTQSYIQNAMLVLRDWNLNDEEIELLIKKKMNETGKDKT